jgi:hypothetical protein
MQAYPMAGVLISAAGQVPLEPAVVQAFIKETNDAQAFILRMSITMAVWWWPFP